MRALGVCRTFSLPHSILAALVRHIYLILNRCILFLSLPPRFILSRTLGITCLLIYAVFLTIAILFELNVFYVVTLPTCPSDY